MAKRVLEAEAVDLMADGVSSFERGDLATAVDRFLRAGRRRDADRRALLHAGDDEASAGLQEDAREIGRREALTLHAAQYRLNVQIGLADMPGYSMPVAVFGAWKDEYAAAAELLFVENCDPVLPNGCWPWIGAVNRKGVPVVSLGGPANLEASAFGYRLFCGDFPRGLIMEHRCPHGTLRCVSIEPDHFELVKLPRYNALDVDRTNYGGAGDLR